MTTACVLQHISCEPPGEYEDVLIGRGFEVMRVQLDEGDALPRWEEPDLLVVMGGPMSVADEVDHPWLADEKRLIEVAVRAGKPFFGVCLGAQLLAASLQAPVLQGPHPEVGVLPVELTSEAATDPVFSSLCSPLEVLQWHSDTFELPAGAVRLAASRAYENQAFRVGDRAYGLQFHLEVTRAMFEEWAGVPAYIDALRAALGEDGTEAFADEFTLSRPAMAGTARVLFERFLDVVLS
ncbi:MAG: type 1 glutamine amidotransferase [Acidimicrobiales bacterium]